jgi:glycosyltransferase involved in cell wall biosynthesis
MYPSNGMKGYAIFVKNIMYGLSKFDIIVKCSALIKGRSNKKYIRLFAYVKFYIDIMINYFKKYDIIYIHYPNYALPILFPLFKLFPRKVVVNLHGEDLLYGDNFLNKNLGILNDRFLNEVDSIIVPSEYFREIVLQRIKCNSEKVFVSPSGGIDQNKFYPIHKNKSSDSIHLGYVGRIEQGKGWKEFIETLSILNNKLKFTATLIGCGVYENDMLELINSYQLNNKIQHIRNVSQDELREYYSSFDLLIFSSTRKSESLGLVGIESMACGIPVIGSEIGGITSYLKDGYNGYISEVGNANMVSDNVILYSNLTNYQKEQMSRNCLVTAENYYTEKIYNKLAELFINIYLN